MVTAQRLKSSSRGRQSNQAQPTYVNRHSQRRLNYRILECLLKLSLNFGDLFRIAANQLTQSITIDHVSLTSLRDGT